MSDKIKKDEASQKESVDKPKVTKKTSSVKKETTSTESGATQESTDNKILDKLKAMGVMADGKKNNDAVSENKNGFQIVLVVSIVAIIAVGYFVWMLNENVEGNEVAENSNNIQPVSQNISQYNNQNNNPYSNYNRELQQRMNAQREQYNNWVQHKRV